MNVKTVKGSLKARVLAPPAKPYQTSIMRHTSQQPLAKVKRRLSLTSSKTCCLQRVPVDIIDADLVVPAVMWIRIGEDLPIEPRNTRSIDLRRPRLDVVVPRPRANWRTTVAVVIGGIRVACAPFLHDELLAGILGFGDVWLERRGLEVAYAVGVDGEHVERAAGEVGFKERIGKVGSPSRGDKDVRVVLHVILDRFGHGALP
jgi:hypothetical protein